MDIPCDAVTMATTQGTIQEMEMPRDQTAAQSDSQAPNPRPGSIPCSVPVDPQARSLVSGSSTSGDLADCASGSQAVGHGTVQTPSFLLVSQRWGLRGETAQQRASVV